MCELSVLYRSTCSGVENMHRASKCRPLEVFVESLISEFCLKMQYTEQERRKPIPSYSVSTPQ
jgi:hypothetical protein